MLDERIVTASVLVGRLGPASGLFMPHLKDHKGFRSLKKGKIRFRKEDDWMSLNIAYNKVEHWQERFQSQKIK